MQALHAFGHVTGTFDSHLAENGLQSAFMQALLHTFLSVGPLYRRCGLARTTHLGISLNLVSAFFGFLFPQRFVMDRRRRRCGNCGKAGAFFAEAFPNSLWKSSRRSRRRLPCSISTAAAVSTARCRPAQGCVWRGGNRCRSPMPGIVPEDRKSTRLNSSHGYISYAVFCLKKKKMKTV